jgi:hypothetical protein
MSIEQVVNTVDTAANKLPYIESLYEQAKDEVDNLKDRKLYLLKDVDFLSAKISRLQEITYSLEQNCRRRKGEQGIQEFDDANEMTKMFVANIFDSIQALVNNDITSSIPASSSTMLPFSLPSSEIQVYRTKNDLYKKQNSEIHQINEGDIVDN